MLADKTKSVALLDLTQLQNISTTTTKILFQNLKESSNTSRDTFNSFQDTQINVGCNKNKK